MAGGFKGLGKKEQAAVTGYVSGEYDRLVFQSQKSYVSLNTQNDPEGWQEKLREMIASDPERVREIVDAGTQERRWWAEGFTLIELSIVLVIIGLIVGGVLVGQDLIRAAGVRATITQIEKYNIAANTFFGKYGALPGDLNAQVANTFGFTPRGQYAGEGDGNGLIEGVWANASGKNYGWVEGAGETVMFWVDLTSANGQNLNLIDGNFSAASPNVVAAVTPASLSGYFPAARLGRGNFVYVWSGGSLQNGLNNNSNGANYFGFSAVSSVPASGSGYSCGYCMISTPSLTVQEAYSIDTKVDDGIPQSGRVISAYLNAPIAGNVGVAWASGGGLAGASASNGPTTAATPGSATTCYDNGNVGGATQQYSVEISNGANVNCALSFKMQAGD